jgi:hypothetical protein
VLSRYLSTSQRREAAAAPTVTAANNGVSLNGTIIVLGNDAGGHEADLLSDREVNLEGFNISFIEALTGTVAKITEAVFRVDADLDEAVAGYTVSNSSGGSNARACFLAGSDAGTIEMGIAGSGYLNPGMPYLKAASGRGLAIIAGDSSTPANTYIRFCLNEGADPTDAAPTVQINPTTVDIFGGAHLVHTSDSRIGIRPLSGENFNIGISLQNTSGTERGFVQLNPNAGNMDVGAGGGYYLRLFSDGNERVRVINAGGSIVFKDDLTNTVQEFDQLGNVIIAGSYKSAQPSANGPGLWLLGKRVAGAVALDATQYIEVQIDGIIRKLLIAA